MDRYWFLTWRTYGTWLPGHVGFVGYYRVPVGPRQNDNVPGELPSDSIPALAKYATDQMVCEPVLLAASHAPVIHAQINETAAFRSWKLDAIAILATHVHVVFGVRGDPTPTSLLRDLKSYCSRALNSAHPCQPKWWAERGSTRFLDDQQSRVRAIKYVRDQENPLLTWLSDDARQLVEPPA